jgi:hypothetical protein
MQQAGYHLNARSWRDVVSGTKMARKYGEIHRFSDFIARTIPSDVSDGPSLTFVKKVIAFLQRLDRLELTNPNVTHAFHTGDGIWIYFKGAKLCLIKPTQKHLLLHSFQNNELRRLVRAARRKETNLFGDTLKGTFWLAWRVQDHELLRLAHLLESLPKRTSTKVLPADHPRYIPAEIRHAVLEDFLRTGSRCSGVPSRGVKPHKVTTERIVFDHIIPIFRGGASTLQNVQVMCAACNSLKRATVG